MFAEIPNGLTRNPDSRCLGQRSSWCVGIAVEAEHAVLIRRDGFEVEAGFAQQCDIAAERSQRDAEAAAIVRDGYRLAAGEECGEPDDADEAEGDAVAVRLRGTAAATRPGFRRGRVELWACHSVVTPSGDGPGRCLKHRLGRFVVRR